MTDKYELSRRKALIGLGTIGAAGAAAGYGTSALFSDEEEFDNNIVEAGTLDMAVTGEIVAANDEYIQENTDITGNAITADGAVETGFEVRDFKPGDWFILCMTVDSVADNPFYVTLHGDTLEEREGANTEPESGVDADLSGPDPDDELDASDWETVTAADDDVRGELGDKLLATYWEQWDSSEGTRASLENLDNITNAASPSAYLDRRDTLTNGGDPNEDGVVQSDVEYTNLREFYFGDPSTTTSNDPLGNGFASGDGILVGGTSDPVKVGRTDNVGRRRLSDPDSDDESELVFYLCFELPEEVGNEIQGDAVRGNFRINAEQVRNNDDPRSGRS